MSVIENEYSKTITANIPLNSSYKNAVKPFIGFLFWASIIWRLSIQENSGFKLKLKEEKKLGRILKSYLHLDHKKIEPNASDHDLKDIGYKVLRAPNYSDTHSTWLHWSPFYERSYSFIIDEYLLFFYFKKNYLIGMTMDFYGTESLKKKADFNTPFSGENILGFYFAEYDKISEKLISFGVRARMKTLNKNLDLIHQKIGGKGKEMHPSLKMEILKRIVDSEEALGKRHTIENQLEIIKQAITEVSTIREE